jgi:hypothetical protein
VTSQFTRKARPFGLAGRPVRKNRPCVTALMILGATATLYEVSGFSRALHAQAGPYERQRIDEAAAARGRAVYEQHCINCHGSTGKGSDRGPDLIRSLVVLRDRLGSAIGPALVPSAVHRAKLTGAQVVDLSHFLHQRIESIVSNRKARAPIDVLTPTIGGGFGPKSWP